MKNEKETKQKLLQAAKAEFMEKGYMQASLREICKKAGVTTGALYFFFQDKDDLFCQIVEEPITKIKMLMENHHKAEMDFLLNGNRQENNFEEDMAASIAVIDTIYNYKEEMLLLITKSQGASLDTLPIQFILACEKQFRVTADIYSERTHTPKLRDDLIHWFAHMLVDVYVCMITHIDTKEEAIKFMQEVLRFMNVGWFGMFDMKEIKKKK